MKRTYCNLYLTAIVLLAVSSIAIGATEIQLREQVESKSGVVRLGDVAEIAADGAEQQRLAGLLLMPAPAPGTKRFVRVREIQDMLAAHGIDLSQLRFGGADKIAVVSPVAASDNVPMAATASTTQPIDRQAVLLAGQMKRTSAATTSAAPLDEVDLEAARSVLDRLIVDYLTAKAGRADSWRLTCNVSDRYLALLQAATSTPKCIGGEDPWTGRQRFVISFTTANGPVQMPVYADIALATQVVVAVRPIERGVVITASHVDLQTVDYVPTTSDRRTPVDSVEKLIGMESQQAIKPGDMVYLDQVRAPLLVRRGELVNVRSQGGRIRVRSVARATQDGARGDLVQVETLGTKERFDVRIVGTRETTVFAAARGQDAEPKLERTETALRLRSE